MGVGGGSSSRFWVVGGLVFWFVLGWVERFFVPCAMLGVCWVGWDEDGWIHCKLMFFGMVFCWFIKRPQKFFDLLLNRGV